MDEQYVDFLLAEPDAPEPECWYCNDQSEALAFSWEFDTWVHLTCIKVRVESDPGDREAQILARELIPGYAAAHPLPPHDEGSHVPNAGGPQEIF